MTIREIFEKANNALKPGTRIRICNEKETSVVVNQFNDGDNDITVYKTWSPYRKRWYYHAEYTDVVEFSIKLAKENHYGKYGEGKLKNVDQYNAICEKYNLKSK